MITYSWDCCTFADHGWSVGEEEVKCIMESCREVNDLGEERPSSWNAERKAVLIALL